MASLTRVAVPGLSRATLRPRCLAGHGARSALTALTRTRNKVYRVERSDRADGGCGLAVKAPDCGSGDRGFKSRHPPFFISRFFPGISARPCISRGFCTSSTVASRNRHPSQFATPNRNPRPLRWANSGQRVRLWVARPRPEILRRARNRLRLAPMHAGGQNGRPCPWPRSGGASAGPRTGRRANRSPSRYRTAIRASRC